MMINEQERIKNREKILSRERQGQIGKEKDENRKVFSLPGRDIQGNERSDKNKDNILFEPGKRIMRSRYCFHYRNDQFRNLPSAQESEEYETGQV